MYLKIATVAKEYEVSVSTVGHMLPDIRKLIGERYPKDAVISTGKLVRVRDDVIRDYMLNAHAIRCGVAPEFRPKERHVWEGDWNGKSGF